MSENVNENEQNENVDDKISRLKADQETTEANILDDTIEFTETMEVSDTEDPKFGTIAADETVETEETETEEKKKNNVLFYIFSAALIVVAIVVVFFIVYPERWNKLTGSGTDVTDNTELTTADGQENGDLLVVEEGNTEDGTLTPDGSENEVAIDNTNNEIVDETNTTNVVEDENAGIYSDNKWGLTIPCYLVSYLSLGNEDKAMTEAAKLQNLGFEAGYYWIPDITDGGAALYKVYVGPFSTRTEAEAKLPGVKKIEDKSYIVTLQ